MNPQIVYSMGTLRGDTEGDLLQFCFGMSQLLLLLHLLLRMELQLILLLFVFHFGPSSV